MISERLRVVRVLLEFPGAECLSVALQRWRNEGRQPDEVPTWAKSLSYILQKAQLIGVNILKKNKPIRILENSQCNYKIHYTPWASYYMQVNKLKYRFTQKIDLLWSIIMKILTINRSIDWYNIKFMFFTNLFDQNHIHKELPVFN